MFLAGVLGVIYILIAIFSGLMTCDEQRRTGGRSLFYRALGFLACAFWPITFLAVAIAARRQQG